MTMHRDDSEPETPGHAADHAPGRDADAATLDSGTLVPAERSQPPATLPPARSPVVLEARMPPRRPGRLGTVWSHPASIGLTLSLILLLVAALAWSLLREPRIGADSAATASPTPSHSASTVLATPSRDRDLGTPGAVVLPSGGPSSNTGGAGLPLFGLSAEKPLAAGALRVELNTYGILINSFGEWRSADGYGGRPDGEGSDITFTTSGITGRGGLDLALLKAVTLPNFETCKTQQMWTPTLTWQEATTGTFVCVRTQAGRRGLMRIDEEPEMDADALGRTPIAGITGVLWTPIVDR